MSSDWKYLNNAATQRWAELSPIDNKTRLQDVIKIALRGILMRACPLLTIAFISLLLFGGFLICAVSELIEPQYTPLSFHLIMNFCALHPVLCFLVSPFSFVLSFSLFYLIQHQEPLKSWFSLSKACYPEELEDLFNGLQTRVFEAKTDKGRIPKHLFNSSWRTLLAAGPELNFLQILIWDKRAKAYRGDIEIRRLPHSLETSSPRFPTFTIESDSILSAPLSASAPTVANPLPRRRYTPHWISKIPENHFEEYFNFILEKQPRRLGKSGGQVRPWTNDKIFKHRIVLKAAHSFSLALSELHTGNKFPHQLMVNTCKKALEKAKKHGQIGYVSLDERKDPSSVEWVDKVLGTGDAHDYAWIKRAIEEITGGNVSG